MSFVETALLKVRRKFYIRPLCNVYFEVRVPVIDYNYCNISHLK